MYGKHQSYHPRFCFGRERGENVEQEVLRMKKELTIFVIMSIVAVEIMTFYALFRL